MKKVVLAIFMVVYMSVHTHAETVTFTSDSGDWYHKASFAMDMAQTRAENRARKVCRENGGSTLYNESELGTYKCKKKQKSGKTKHKCEVAVSIQCATKGEVTLTCAKSKKKLFNLEGISGSKKNILKIKDTKSGIKYTINMHGMSNKQIYNMLCSEHKDPTYTEKFFNKLKKSFIHTEGEKEPVKPKEGNKYEYKSITATDGKRG